MVKRKKKSAFRKMLYFLIFLVKIPYFIFVGVRTIFIFFRKKAQNKNEIISRGKIKSKYHSIQIVSKKEGDFSKWEKSLVEGNSKIGIILGARGTGKTALGVKLLENIHAKTGKKCYAIGLDSKKLPLWIEQVDEVSQIKNNSVVLIDEGGILFSSRKAMTSANKMLSDLLMISRHKNISVIFIAQNSSNLEINAIRQADFLALKPSSLLQKNFERKVIGDIYNEVESEFKNYSNIKGITHIYSDDFRGFVANKLPSFWSEKISKGFADKKV